MCRRGNHVIKLCTCLVVAMVVLPSWAEDAVDAAEAAYDKALVDVKKEFEAKTKATKENYANVLKELFKTAAAKGDMDLAQKAIAKSKALENEDQQVANQPQPTATAMPAEQAEKANSPLKNIKPGPRSPAQLYAKSDDQFTIYLNGQRICTGGSKLTKKDVGVGVGDVVTVKAVNMNYTTFGFACLIRVGNSVIPSNTTNWKSYTPKNENLWFQPDQIERAGTTMLGNQQDVKEEVVGAVNADCDAIWADGKGTTAYLFLQITQECFVPLGK